MGRAESGKITLVKLDIIGDPAVGRFVPGGIEFPRVPTEKCLAWQFQHGACKKERCWASQVVCEHGR